MKALARWRAGAVVLMAVGALMPLALARQARGRSARALAARDATAAAAYLTIVTPSPPRGGAGYDLPQLLIRARALEELPGFSGRFEIYQDRKSTRLNSSHMSISYAVFCLKKKKLMKTTDTN